MKKVLYSTIIAAVACAAMSCGSSKNLDPAQMEVLRWGNGGGFAGIEVSYQLREDGQLSSSSKQGQPYQVLRQVDQSRTDQIFSNAQVLQLGSLKYMFPGNTYKFISKGVGEQFNRVAWNDQNEKGLPSGLNVFYNNLMHLVHNH